MGFVTYYRQRLGVRSRRDRLLRFVYIIDGVRPIQKINRIDHDDRPTLPLSTFL